MCPPSPAAARPDPDHLRGEARKWCGARVLVTVKPNAHPFQLPSPAHSSQHGSLQQPCTSALPLGRNIQSAPYYEHVDYLHCRFFPANASSAPCSSRSRIQHACDFSREPSPCVLLRVRVEAALMMGAGNHTVLHTGPSHTVVLCPV